MQTNSVPKNYTMRLRQAAVRRLWKPVDAEDARLVEALKADILAGRAYLPSKKQKARSKRAFAATLPAGAFVDVGPRHLVMLEALAYRWDLDLAAALRALIEEAHENVQRDPYDHPDALMARGPMTPLLERQKQGARTILDLPGFRSE